MSLSQSTLTSFLKRSAPETHDADDGTSNVVHSKKKKSEDNKKKYETKRIRKFQPAWQKEFDWVVYQEETNKMYCSTCRKYAELADKSSPMYIGCGDGVQGFRRETLTAHSKSRRHVVCHTRLLNDQKPENRPLQTTVSRISQESQARLEKLFNTAHYIAKENLAFQKYASLCDLQAKNQVDLGPNYRNPKACKTLVSAIADTEWNEIRNELQGARFFSVLADGSTDCGIIEQESVFVRYIGPGGAPKTQFADLVDATSGDAKG